VLPLAVCTTLASACRPPQSAQSLAPLARMSVITRVLESQRGLIEPATGVEYGNLPSSIAIRRARVLMSPPRVANARGSIWELDSTGHVTNAIRFSGKFDSTSVQLLLAHGRGDTIWAVDRNRGCVATLDPQDRWHDVKCLEGMTMRVTGIVRFPDGSTLSAEQRLDAETVGYPLQSYDSLGRWRRAVTVDDDVLDPRWSLGRVRHIRPGLGNDAWIFQIARPILEHVSSDGRLLRRLELDLPGFVLGPKRDTLPSRALPPWSGLVDVAQVSADTLFVVYRVPNPAWRDEARWVWDTTAQGKPIDRPARVDRVWDSRIATIHAFDGRVIAVDSVSALVGDINSSGWFVAARQVGQREWRVDLWRVKR